MTATSHALATARTHRDELYHSILGIERALTAPGGGRPASWSRTVLGALTELRTALEGHVEATEGAGGLFEDIMGRDPRLAHAIERLRTEHRRFLDAVERGEARLGSVADQVSVEQIRAGLLDLVHQLLVHRHRGAELVYEAYNVDVSAGD